MPKILKPHKKPKTTGPVTAQLLGDFVKAKRTEVGLKIEELAQLCKTSKDTITKIENAREGVRFESILNVCKMLGIELMVRPWDSKDDV